MLGHFNDWVLMVCVEVSWKKSVRRSKGDTLWRNEEMKEAVLGKKDAHKAMCLNILRGIRGGIKE